MRRVRYAEYPEIFARLRTYVEKILARHRLKPTRVSLWRRGVSSYVFVLEGKRKLALKISPRYPLKSEIFFYEHAKLARVPVPKIIAQDTSHRLIPFDYHITEWIYGEIPDRLGARDHYHSAFELGRVVARLHRIKLGGFGYPKVRGRWSHANWRSALRDFMKFEPRLSEMNLLFGKSLKPIIKAILKDPKLEVRPVLIHSDLGEDQYLVFREKGMWRVAGLLDPGFYVSGDPMFDFANALITWNKAPHRRGFEDGYRSIHALTREEHYRLERLRVILQAWAAMVVYRINKKSARRMAGDAVKAMKRISKTSP
jgi:aminoglycoside phosphotransferase (APT) family kinase protein